MGKVILLFLIYVMYTGQILAKGPITDSQVGGVLIAPIIMTVGTPTCTLDSAVEDINFGDVTIDELRKASRTLSAKATLTCETTPSGITLTVNPVGSSVAVLTQPGVITSTLQGTGFALTWAEGSAIGIKNEPVEYNTPLSLPVERMTVINLNIKPVITSGGVVSGPSQAQVSLILKYS
ncbi:fimbrial protein [Citrobacter cronae]|uniref:fimbrial protein n=1 Tax=Citrobacter cronae TaxID=1748967 RepID=UPI0021D2E423|nr:fimbrial protein [Citrobacter cronae]MCU6198649.1 fimbrial protein [Citrobacter cronae]